MTNISISVGGIELVFHKWLQVIQVGWAGDINIPSCHFCPALSNGNTGVTLTQGCSDRWKLAALLLSCTSIIIYSIPLMRLPSPAEGIVHFAPPELYLLPCKNLPLCSCSDEWNVSVHLRLQYLSGKDIKTCELRMRAAVSPLFFSCFALDK